MKEECTTPDGKPPFPPDIEGVKYRCCDEVYLGDDTDTFETDSGYFHLRKHLINGQP